MRFYQVYLALLPFDYSKYGTFTWRGNDIDDDQQVFPRTNSFAALKLFIQSLCYCTDGAIVDLTLKVSPRAFSAVLLLHSAEMSEETENATNRLMPEWLRRSVQSYGNINGTRELVSVNILN